MYGFTPIYTKFKKEREFMSNDILSLLKDLSVDIKEIRKDNQRFEVSIEKLNKTVEYEIENRKENEEMLKELKISLLLIQKQKEDLSIKTNDLDNRQKALEEKMKTAEDFNKNLVKNTIKIVLGVCGFVGGVATWALSYFFK